jgi:hypothetical protein
LRSFKLVAPRTSKVLSLIVSNKRLRQWLENFLPEQIDDILNKLYIYRSQIKGDFEQKVEAMNKVTENLIEEHD